MLERAHFQNFRCLRDVTIAFGPLTVLVGPNGSGKSSVLRGLLPDPLSSPSEIWRHSTDLSVVIELLFENAQTFKKSWIVPSNRSKAGGFTYSAQLLHLDLQDLRRPVTAEKGPQLESTGRNLANVFSTLTRTEQGQLAASFSRLIPTFADVNVQPLVSGQQHLLFQDRWNGDAWYAAHEVSDGTMLVLAYLVLQYQRPQVDLLLVEEPERGIHPYLMGSLVSLLRGMSKGEIGPRPVQIVLATHSADLLDHLE